jgi:p-aminobenzoyl-glutamate transporter AbgT
MTNPFETGQIKNYILLYASVIVIMILFFIATTLFNKPEKITKKEFNTELNATQKAKQLTKETNNTQIKSQFKLLKKSY